MQTSLQDNGHNSVGLQGELGAEVFVADDDRHRAVGGVQHDKHQTAVRVFERDRMQVLGIFCGCRAYGTALNEFREVSDGVVDRGVDEFFLLGIVQDGGIAPRGLVLEHHTRAGDGLVAAVVERAAFFAQQQIPVTERGGEVVEIFADLDPVTFGKGEQVGGDVAAVFCADQRFVVPFVHEAQSLEMIARIPVMRYAPHALLHRLGGEDVLCAVVDTFFVVIPDHDLEVGEPLFVERGDEVLLDKFAFLLRRVTAAFPRLTRVRLVLDGDCRDGDTLGCHRFDVFRVVVRPHALIFFFQFTAAGDVLALLHVRRRTPGRGEQDDLLAAEVDSVLDEGNDVFPFTVDGEGGQILVAVFDVGVNVEREVAGIDVRSAKVVGDTVLAREVLFQKVLLLRRGEQGIVVCGGLGERAAEADYRLVIELVEHVDDTVFGGGIVVAVFDKFFLEIAVLRGDGTNNFHTTHSLFFARMISKRAAVLACLVIFYSTKFFRCMTRRFSFFFWTIFAVVSVFVDVILEALAGNAHLTETGDAGVVVLGDIILAFVG